jgi:hypothetical protein
VVSTRMLASSSRAAICGTYSPAALFHAPIVAIT